jgi:threonine dehydrogenase-like Zn-dependent dehydrogenase
VLVTGAGPIGLLAALLGVQRGLEVHVLDRVESGPKPELTTSLGARYHTAGLPEVALDTDIVIECTGVPQVVLDVMTHNAPNATVCLLGITAPSLELAVDMGDLGRRLVLDNDVVFGTVNANRRHYEAAADALDRADRGWLERVINRRVPLDRWSEALERRPDDVKVAVDFTA